MSPLRPGESLREKRRAAIKTKRQADLDAKATEAQIESTAATTESTRATLLKTKFDTLRAVIASIAVTYGILAVFCYTFFGAQFFPGGLTAGETLFFGFVAVALGLLGLLLSGFIAAWLLPFVSRPTGRSVRQLDALRSRQLAYLTFIRSRQGISHWRRLLLPLVASIRVYWPRRTRFIWLCISAAAIIAMILLALVIQFVPAASDPLLQHPGLGSGLLYSAIALTYFIGTWGLAAHSDGVEFFGGFMIAFASTMCGAFFIWLALKPEGLYVIEGSFVGGISLMAAFSLAGAQTKAQTGQKKQKDDQKRDRVPTPPTGTISFFICMAIVAPTFLAVAAPHKATAHRLASFVFGGFGIRIDDATLSLSGSAAEAIRGTSEINDVPVSLCKADDGRYLMADVNVLWHGIGTKTYIEWPASAQAASSPTLKMDLMSAELNVVRGTRVRCVDIPDYAFFESNKGNSLTGDGERDLTKAVKEQLASADAVHQRLSEVDVIGHADPMPRPHGNESLAQDRAEVVARLIQGGLAASGYTSNLPVVKAISRGSRDATNTCSTTIDLPTQRECNARNRDVEVRLRFVAATPTATATSAASR